MAFGIKKQAVIAKPSFMDIERNSKEDGIRLVNINTIKALVFNGVKYVVE